MIAFHNQLKNTEDDLQHHRLTIRGAEHSSVELPDWRARPTPHLFPGPQRSSLSSWGTLSSWGPGSERVKTRRGASLARKPAAFVRSVVRPTMTVDLGLAAVPKAGN